MKIKLLILLLCFTLLSCKNEFDSFNDKAEIFNKSDKSINEKEFEQLKEDALLSSKDRAFKRFFTNDKLDEIKLKKYLKEKGFVLKWKEVNHKNDVINVYLENSGSMFGYVNGDTEYKDALTELLVQLGELYGKKKIHLNFVNTGIYPLEFEGNVAQYPQSLNPSVFRNFGDVSNSNLNDIFRQILENSTDNTVSILVSDLIYSVSGEDTSGKLEIQKSLTKDAFQGNKDVATVLLQMTSKFNGDYYTKQPSKIKLSNKQRPYYILATSTTGNVNYFNKNIDLKKCKGYQNKFVITPENYSQGIYYSVVTTAKSTSGFRPTREFSDASSIKGIEDIEVNKRNGDKFSFTIAINMANIPVEEEFIKNTENYAIDGYSISIADYNEKLLKPNSLQMINKSGVTPTHLITLTATTAKHQDVTLLLKRKMLKWVYECSTTDDTTIDKLGGKTFGFNYLVEGINEALPKEISDNYFDIQVKINN